MLELARLLALVAFVALALALVVFLRRAGQLIAETRERETFRRQVVDLVERAGASLDGVAQRIDAVRRHTAAPSTITDNLSAATEAVARYAEEARAIGGSRPSVVEIRDALVGELERASRGLQMVEHGCAMLATTRRGSRDLEGQTSIKRGYLGILHAREAMIRHGARAVELTAADPPRLFQRRNA